MGSGFLIVKAYLAADALPVEGALVRVESVDEGVSGVARSRITDRDGVAGPIPLPAPPLAFSRSPSPEEQPYATYRVTVIADGYYTKRVYGVAVFDGITTVLPVNMIGDTLGMEPPEDTLNSESHENPNLE